MKARLITMITVACAAAACAGTPENPPEVAPSVELERYLGTWYEQGSIPIRPQRGCVGTTATYSLRDDGDIDVVNTCYKDGWDADQTVAEGKAFVVDTETGAKLEVQFFWPFRGDYWIVGLDAENYEWALVGSPNLETFWVLTREPVISEERFEEFLQMGAEQGFPVDRVQRTEQKPEDERPAE